MYARNKKNPNYRICEIFLSQTGRLYGRIASSWTLRLFITLTSLVLCPAGFGADFHSGNQYYFSTDYSDNYSYQWSASNGNYNENNKNTFIWIAPYVNIPTEVTISVLVIDNTCSCHATFSETIIVMPDEEDEIKIGTPLNSTNTTKPYSSTETPQNLSADANNETALALNGNETELSPLSNAVESNNETANSIIDAIKATNLILKPEKSITQDTLAEETDTAQSARDLEENAATRINSTPEANLEIIEKANSVLDIKDMSPQGDADISQVEPDVDVAEPDQAAAGPSEIESSKEPSVQEGSGTIIDVSMLEFSDGTQVDVMFVESSSSVGDATYAVPHDEYSNLGEGSAGSDGSSPDSNASSVNATPISELIDQIIEQTELPSNQTENNETAPKVEEKEPIPSDSPIGMEQTTDGDGPDNVAPDWEGAIYEAEDAAGNDPENVPGSASGSSDALIIQPAPQELESPPSAD